MATRGVDYRCGKMARFLWRRFQIHKRKGDVLWYVSHKGFLSRFRIELLRNIHAGQRCFILGNGPSLRKTDLRRLSKEYTIGLNRIYLLFDEMGFATTYHVCVNELVLEQWGREILDLPCTKFVAWKARNTLPLRDDMMFLRTLSRPGFSDDITDGLWEGTTVTFVALQIAFHLGFEEVILIGVDHHFTTSGEAHRQMTSEGDDVDHFAPNYFGKGARWQLPDLRSSEVAYEVARIAYQQTGRKIVDATLNGKLNVFEKVEYENLF
jgi:hypothetical protein